MSGSAQAELVVNQIPPTITNFLIPSVIHGESQVQIRAPQSDSTGAFSYASSNESVATISGNYIRGVSPGTSTITATQAASGNYSTGSATTTFEVLKSTATNRAKIDSVDGLSYFLATESIYSDIRSDIEVNTLSTTSPIAKILSTSEESIKITQPAPVQVVVPPKLPDDDTEEKPDLSK